MPIPRPDVRRMLVPLGPVAVFGASNFPLAFSTAGGDTASALAAGCPVVVKGHPVAPGHRRARRARAARRRRRRRAARGGTFAHLPASGVEVGEALVDDPGIAAVGFTGSIAGGRAIHDRAAAAPVPIPVYAEMGSINPIVVTDAALAARAGAIAEGLTASVATFGGQLCTKPGVVFVPAGEAGDAFAADVAARLDARRADRAAQRAPARRAGRRGASGSPRAPRCGRSARAGAAERGRASATSRPPSRRPPPRSRTSPELLEEHFGPVVVLLRHGSAGELRAALGQLDGQLTASLHAEPARTSPTLVDALAERAGRVVFDGFPTGVAVTHGMHHGGPYPACSNPLHTSVGATAIRRWLRPRRVPERAGGGAPARAGRTPTRWASGAGWTAS